MSMHTSTRRAICLSLIHGKYVTPTRAAGRHSIGPQYMVSVANNRGVRGANWQCHEWKEMSLTSHINTADLRSAAT